MLSTMINLDTEQLLAVLNEFDIIPSTELGQHFLIDRAILEAILELVTSGNVIEVGSGIGNLTELMAQRGNTVYGLEIDRQFQPILEKVTAAHPNVKISFTDALRADFEQIIGKRNSDLEWQVVANLPYHISEPFLKKLIDLSIESVVLLVGKKLATAMLATGTDSPDYSKTSLVTQSFFEPILIQDVGSEAFYPEPRVESAIVMLIPLARESYKNNRVLQVLRHLVQTEIKQTTVRAAIKEALDASGAPASSKNGVGKKIISRQQRRTGKIELKQYLGEVPRKNPGENGQERRDARFTSSKEIIEQLELPEYVLSAPFSRLDNSHIKVLVDALEKVLGM